MNRSAFVGIAGLIVGGLAVIAYNLFIAPTPKANGCPGGDRHCIEVSVITVGGQAQIAPIPDRVVRDQGAVISWMIVTDGYTFSDGGIAFNKASAPTPPNEFTCNVVHKTAYRCIDKKNSIGKFGYVVTLSGNPAVAPLDPYIVNQ